MRSIIAMALAAALGFAAVPSQAAVNTVVAGPGATIAGYATTQIVVVKAADATFVNLDPDAHDVESVATKSNGKPLFHSEVINLGETSLIEGIAALTPGEYPFHCSIHKQSMTGTLTVLA